MNANDLADKWKLIENLPREGDYDHIRIAPNCHAELSIGISPQGSRCLILILPDRFSFDFVSVKGDKLSLDKITNRNYVVLTLDDFDYRALFDDLIVSFFNSVHEIEDVKEYSEAFIVTFGKWSKFFEPVHGDRVSREVIQGMFGELVFLRWLIGNLPNSRVNEALNAWRGPYDRGPDFVLDDRDVEVKSRTLLNTGVRILTENQLDQREGKGLQLSVVSLDPDHPEARPLSSITREVVSMVEAAQGDTSILYQAMSQKDIVPINLEVYDDLVWLEDEIIIYDCLRDGFPRITRTSLSDAIFGVSYSLNTAELSEFILEVHPV